MKDCNQHPGHIEWDSKSDYVFDTDLYIDGQKTESIQLPVRFTTRRHELAWKYDLPKGKHSVVIKIKNPSNEHRINLMEAIIYADKSIDGMKEKEKEAQNFKIKSM